MSLAVTSSHRQAKHLPLRSLVTGGGTATSGGRFQMLSRRLRPAWALVIESWSPKPSAWAASAPATLPDSSASSSTPGPQTSPAACRPSGTWESANTPRSAS